MQQRRRCRAGQWQVLTAQWQAALMSQVRPASIVSKAPRLTSDSASSVDWMLPFGRRIGGRQLRSR
jgi:hypothetical protein